MPLPSSQTRTAPPATAPLPSSLAWRANGSGPSPHDVARIESLVRQILTALLQPTPATAVVPTPAFAGPLLADRHAEALPAGTTDLSIDPATVVTPLARERLKRRGITLRIVSRAELARTGHVAEWGLAFESGGDLLRRALLNTPEPWHDLGDQVAHAASWIAEARTRAGVIITDAAALACYRACQTANVRGAVIHDVEGLRHAIDTLNPNCLVVERPALSIHAIRHLCATFRRFTAMRHGEARP
jgi:hypothetical protein